MATQDDGFIGRWARRKAENSNPDGLKKKQSEVVAPVRGRMITEPLPVKEADPGEDAIAEINSNVALAPAEDQGAPVAKTDTHPEDAEPDIDELEQIDIEALDYNADFTKFMQPGVPERLRQRALKRLWNTNPVLANIDGLNDYDDDFTDAALAVDALKTAWQVGRGYLNDEEVAARDAELAGEPLPEAIDGDAVEDTPALADAASRTDDPMLKDNQERATEVANGVPAEGEDDLETDEA